MDDGTLDGKRILVTGGTGSFGHQIVARLLEQSPAEIRIFSRDEEKQDRMRAEIEAHASARAQNVNLILGDVRDYGAVRAAIRDIDVVFHAAALKQVPSCEYAPLEAVKTNVLGAQNIVDAALEENVERVVAVSTDKAVKPVNAMGMTKGIQERLFTMANLRRPSKRTVFCCVRYGNVVGSRGSVVPLFLRQIADGGDLTVTDPSMTRYLLLLSESIDLVFRAARDAVGGEIYVLDIPAATVGDIASVMIEELGGDRTVGMRVIGVRPGEKIHEVLISEEEAPRTVVREPYLIVLPAIAPPTVQEKYQGDERFALPEFTSNSARRLGRPEIAELLRRSGWLSLDQRLVHPTLVRTADDLLDPAVGDVPGADLLR